MSCKHKFKPRFSTRYPSFMVDFMKRIQEVSGRGLYPEQEQIYECDVCVKCGLTTERKDEKR